MPDFVPEIKPEPFDPEWKGGFFCPCHKSRYDMAGRVFQGVPAPANLAVPPYQFVDDTHDPDRRGSRKEPRDGAHVIHPKNRVLDWVDERAPWHDAGRIAST